MKNFKKWKKKKINPDKFVDHGMCLPLFRGGKWNKERERKGIDLKLCTVPTRPGTVPPHVDGRNGTNVGVAVDPGHTPRGLVNTRRRHRPALRGEGLLEMGDLMSRRPFL